MRVAGESESRVRFRTIPLVFRFSTRPLNAYLTFAHPQPDRLPSAQSNVLFLGGPKTQYMHKLLRTCQAHWQAVHG